MRREPSSSSPEPILSEEMKTVVVDASHDVSACAPAGLAAGEYAAAMKAPPAALPTSIRIVEGAVLAVYRLDLMSGMSREAGDIFPGRRPVDKDF